MRQATVEGHYGSVSLSLFISCLILKLSNCPHIQKKIFLFCPGIFLWFSLPPNKNSQVSHLLKCDAQSVMEQVVKSWSQHVKFGIIFSGKNILRRVAHKSQKYNLIELVLKTFILMSYSPPRSLLNDSWRIRVGKSLWKNKGLIIRIDLDPVGNQSWFPTVFSLFSLPFFFLGAKK